MKHGILKGSTLAVLDQGIVSLSNFATGVIVAKAVVPEEFGTYSLFFTGLILLSGLQNACITGPLRVLGVRQDEGGGTGYFSAQLRLQSLLGAAQILGVAFLFGLIGEMDPALLVTFMACVFLFQLQELGRVMHLTRLDTVSLLELDIVTHTARLGALLILASMDMLSAGVALGAIAVAALLGALWTWRKLELDISSSVPLGDVAKENWNFGRWLLLETLAYSASTQIYLFAMALWLDKQAVAVVAAAQVLVNTMNVLVTGVASHAIPVARNKLTTSGYEEWRSWLWRVGIYLTGAAAVFGTIISIASPQLLALIYTPFYAEYAHLVPLLALAFCVQTANNVLSISFRTANMPQAGFAAKSASAIATILLVYPLLKGWGIVGAAVGLLITQLLWTGVYISYIALGALDRNRVRTAIHGASA
jgi:O-antigen/teichoic acid export membrane protein